MHPMSTYNAYRINSPKRLQESDCTACPTQNENGARPSPDATAVLAHCVVHKYTPVHHHVCLKGQGTYRESTCAATLRLQAYLHGDQGKSLLARDLIASLKKMSDYSSFSSSYGSSSDRRKQEQVLQSLKGQLALANAQEIVQVAFLIM